MKSEVIGFEGHSRPEDPVTWGSAAVRTEGGMILNAGSGFGTKGPRAEGEWREFVKDGVVTPLTHPVTVDVEPDGDDVPGMIVLALRYDPQGGSVRPGRLAYLAPGLDLFESTHALVRMIQDKWVAVVYRDRAAFMLDFAQWRDDLLAHLKGCLRTGLVMHAHSFELNALRTTIRCFEGDREIDMIKALGRAILRGPENITPFERIFGMTPETKT